MCKSRAAQMRQAPWRPRGLQSPASGRATDTTAKVSMPEEACSVRQQSLSASCTCVGWGPEPTMCTKEVASV